jgi:hypothetical protein
MSEHAVRKRSGREMSVLPDYDDHGPFDPDELVQWATSYGHPEGWAKKAQQLHAENERLREENGRWRRELGLPDPCETLKTSAGGAFTAAGLRCGCLSGLRPAPAEERGGC